MYLLRGQGAQALICVLALRWAQEQAAGGAAGVRDCPGAARVDAGDHPAAHRAGAPAR